MALGFDLLGWDVEREAQSAAGRTDLELRRNGRSELAIVGLKIWGRLGARDAQRQMERYWTSEVTAGAVVMLTDRVVRDWPEVYRRECLDDVDEAVLSEPRSSPIRGRFTCRSTTTGGMAVEIDHVLLRIPR